MATDPIPERLSDASRERHRQRQQRQAGRFLRGPIPLPWLSASGKLPGKAVTVALVIWFLAGVKKSRSGLRLQESLLKEFGVGRNAASNSLDALEAARLVRLDRSNGKRPLIEILDVPSSKDSGTVSDL